MFCFKTDDSLTQEAELKPTVLPGYVSIQSYSHKQSGKHCLHPETVCKAITLLCEPFLSHQLNLMGFKSQRSTWFIIFCSNRQPSAGARCQLEQSSVGCRRHSLGYSSHMRKSLLILCPDPHSGRADQLPLPLGTSMRQKG